MPWDRKATPLPPKTEDRPSRRGSERDNGDNRSNDNRGDRGDNRGERGDNRGGSGGGNRRESEQPPPAVRPKIILAARKVPVEGSEAPVSKVSDIFGGGKPHDENKYEVCIH